MRRPRTLACWRAQSVWRGELPGGLGMGTARLDWGEMGGPRSCFGGAGAGSGGAPARAEVYAARPVAHRAVDACGELWVSGGVACADSGNRQWAERGGAGALSFARG